MRTDTLLTLNSCLATLFGVGLAIALRILECPDWLTLLMSVVIGWSCGVTAAHPWCGRGR